MMDLARESLLIKRKFIEEYTLRGMYPYTSVYLHDIYKRFGEYWKNHFNTIGINGANEAVMNFLGAEYDLTTKKGRDFVNEIMDHMRDRIQNYQEMDDQIYNLEASPAEGASYRFAKEDRKLFPDIYVANTDSVNTGEAAPYYTNSTQLPVDATEDIFEAMDWQDDLQSKYTGGTVLHIFLGEKLPSVDAVKSLVKKVVHRYKMPYFSITPTFSICPIHGYLSGEHEFCPVCDRELGIDDTKSD
jgi:ribonucleoside-triphosphate reductase